MTIVGGMIGGEGRRETKGKEDMWARDAREVGASASHLILGRASLEGHTWVHGAGQGLTLLNSAQVNVSPWKQTGLKENLSWVDIRENVTSPPAIARGMKESSGGERGGSVSKLSVDALPRG
ncbi:hypothetical protein F5148DRAFT_1151243 [Russula earlei]|uniref:Uncharacterized protein n=1 Tax=Russula earlei TaxID=71964 RepID=A0ACC0U248_9AGAM|nr:hypothetical protein F5148DRAFT_1151243 [Russula earlei]